ncbi:hypothetical protein NEOLEDRAFT_1137631 [Neolentinus lepideus HHB14362 ss-1]|uniref:Uncharacterized protein n=1 Tax=Neolentinus lepideus HHB14362 ss-1 TaxID=1314782 RepID=A0A165QMQ8_9AGAM|nr:hypothetical protein NEOLEDRAFT_1137631 [Neolentinus lepideus HHB14362 ss-1]
MSDRNLLLLSAALSCVVSLLFSLLLFRRLAGWKLHAGRIRLHLKPPSIRIHDLRYSHRTPIPNPDLKLPDQPFSLTAAQIVVKFHIPRPSYPAWATITVKDIFHTSPQSTASSAGASLTLWLFPYAFRFTAGTCARVQIDDFRVRVFDSKSTPRWVEALRGNLIQTMLKGEILRCDDFKTSVHFGVPDRYLSRASRERQQMEGVEGMEEMMITAMLDGYHIKNWQGRIYAMGCVDMQWRDVLQEDRGRFVLIVKEGRWIKVREAYELMSPINPWYQIPSSIIHLPMTLYQTWLDPASAADVYVTTTNVSYDQFRMRDSELLRQASLLAVENAWIFGGIIEGLAGDLLMRKARPGGCYTDAVLETVTESPDRKGLAGTRREQRCLEEVAEENRALVHPNGRVGKE